jgi:CelD/BcsL family acetyltransferase involved in cellulose biosynthesis
MIKIKEVSSAKDFANLNYDWNELLKKSKSDNIFLTHQWVSTWWKYFGKGRELKIIVAEENSELIGIAPFMLEKFYFLKQISFIGVPHSDYHDFILLSGKERMTLEAILKYLYSCLDWDIMKLWEIQQDSITLKILDENLLYPNRKFARCICPKLKLPENWKDLLNMLSPKMRHNLRYYRNRFEKEFKVCYEDIENRELLEENISLLFQLHQKRWTENGSRGAFADSLTKNFYRDISYQFFDKDWLRLRVLKANDHPVSICYNFKYNEKFYYYQSGRDPNWSKYSVGDLLLADTIRYAIQNGYNEFDFLRGEENYKKHWNTKNNYNFRIELVNHRFSSKIKYIIFRFFVTLKDI